MRGAKRRLIYSKTSNNNNTISTAIFGCNTVDYLYTNNIEIMQMIKGTSVREIRNKGIS